MYYPSQLGQYVILEGETHILFLFYPDRGNKKGPVFEMVRSLFVVEISFMLAIVKTNFIVSLSDTKIQFEIT